MKKKIERIMRRDINKLNNYSAKTERTKDTKNKVIKGFEDGDFL